MIRQPTRKARVSGSGIGRAADPPALSLGWRFGAFRRDTASRGLAGRSAVFYVTWSGVCADAGSVVRQDAVHMRTDVPLIVAVDRNAAGGWDVELPDRRARVRCETLDDARRVAFLRVAHSHACTVVVRDAYHRVLDEEFIAGDTDAAPQSPTQGRGPHTVVADTLICTTPERAALSTGFRRPHIPPADVAPSPPSTAGASQQAAPAVSFHPKDPRAPGRRYRRDERGPPRLPPTAGSEPVGNTRIRHSQGPHQSESHDPPQRIAESDPGQSRSGSRTRLTRLPVSEG